MSALSFWSCPNGHIVLDCYMPQSGRTCNVVGCAREREQFTADDSLGVYTAANELLTIVFRDGQRNDDDPSGDLFCTPEAINVERMLTRHCKALWLDDQRRPGLLRRKGHDEPDR